MVRVAVPKGKSRSGVGAFLSATFPEVDLDAKEYNQKVGGGELFLTRSDAGVPLVFERPFGMSQCEGAVSVEVAVLDYVCRCLPLEGALERLASAEKTGEIEVEGRVYGFCPLAYEGKRLGACRIMAAAGSAEEAARQRMIVVFPPAYANIARRYAEAKFEDQEYLLFQMDGSDEGFRSRSPDVGVLVIDVTETGNTLRLNQKDILQDILLSCAVFIYDKRYEQDALVQKIGRGGGEI